MSMHNSYGQPAAARAGTSTAAIASLALGIIGLVTACLAIGGLLGIGAVILGIIALVKIGKPDGPEGGTGMAIGGLITGGLAVLFMPIGVGLMLPAVGAARMTAARMEAMQEAKLELQDITAALNLYASDNGGLLPSHVGVLTQPPYNVPADRFVLQVDIYGTAATPAPQWNGSRGSPTGYVFGDYFWLITGQSSDSATLDVNMPLAIDVRGLQRTGRLVLYGDGSARVESHRVVQSTVARLNELRDDELLPPIDLSPVSQASSP